ncbi:hypothetical protein T440DRAFT_491428 [Plenodomus tracheiphilus IPT5]|uniref:Uncharacterized protein n=1 Tax=Plenodomus tracheiphilus IPT5 TaxID=1408161 RepID=A0A6A7AY92_9PLEO|nr:hypothetical protein T440DRAFT_491428 [Plenodomus tracheiphilus IPT5]
MPLAGSVGSAVLQPNGSPLQMSDRLSVSGLDYSDWADKMVAEGKLFEPSTDKNFTFRIAAASWTLTSLKCGYLASSEQRMNEVAYSGCEFMRLESKFALRFASLITIEEFCAGAVDDTCINNIDAAFTTVGAFVDASFDVFCHDMFLKIFDECPGGVGGSAALSLTADDGTVHKGSLLALNFENDPGATCPANPLEESVCKLQSAG